MLRMLLLLLLLLALPAALPSLIKAAPAYYPRLTPLAGGGAAAVLEAPTPQQRRLLFLARAPGAADWGAPVVIVDAPAADDLANGFLLQLPNGTLLCAFRHHFRAAGGGAMRYTLQLAASHDGGASWGAPAPITSGVTGVWEPFLLLTPSALRVAYSAELTNGGEQDVVLRSSSDGGASWGAVDSVLHTPGSRNGMPGLALQGDGSLLLVCEGFWGAGGWGAFTVNSARSLDGGATWAQRQVAHAPRAPAKAGSPQLALCRNGTVACAVFMSSEGGGGGGGGGAWPDGAHAALLCAPLGAGSAPVDWGAGGDPVAVPAATATIYWPSFLASNGSAHVAYQGSDGAAYLVDAGVC
jgi:hypothetical protein